ncbi:hypothetical protein BTO09_06085 [Gilvibacter sp. SZ-19]|uniref:hypothetical protein n=1 Tax=Gilvibacter sp. SZ-19 TaxID=754429 RepID=UPI000B3C74B9|nr:hypothetical protein [Gilvibacter sp. SZ-19]ARV11935.1 hypothetical protein BTO09_06085 [Gilvibacter sp. SZ-19]
MATLFVAFWFVLPIYGQTKKYRMGSCEAGTYNAEKQAAEGNYTISYYGLQVLTADQSEFRKFYKDYLKQRYGVRLRDGGCSIMAETKCYSKRMSELVNAKFGSNFAERSLNEAEALWTKN